MKEKDWKERKKKANTKVLDRNPIDLQIKKRKQENPIKLQNQNLTTSSLQLLIS
jgi:hypothetical protein